MPLPGAYSSDSLMNMNHKRYLILLTAISGAVLAGCSSHAPKTRLTPGSFAQTRPSAMPAALASKAPVLPESAEPTGAFFATGAEVKPADVPTTQPKANGSKSAVSMGNYMIVGTVLAEANGKPIYADKVLAKLDNVFTQKAKELTPTQFANFAQSMILQQVNSDIRDELEFAAAQRFTSDEDQQIATAYTTMWRQQEINRYGGSLAVTQDRYMHPVDPSVPSQDFDQVVKDQYRKNLTMIYYQRRVWPRVQITVDEMRDFYSMHKEDLFSVKSEVKFRAIQIDIAASGGSRDTARQRMESILEKVKKGDDFGSLATTYNDNRAWRATGGYILVVDKTDSDGNVYMQHRDGRVIIKDKEGFGVIKNSDGEVLQKSKELLEDCQPVRVPQYITPGSLQTQKLEEAVFALEKPGDVTNIVDGGNSLYLAVLEDKHNASVKTFDQPEVQTDIRKRLESERYKELREKESLKLMKEAVVRQDEKMIKSAVDMALQKYTLQNNK